MQQISFSLLADTVVGEVARSHNTWSGTTSSHSENQLLLNRLGEEEPQRIVAVPLVVRGRTVAVLYGDSAGLDSEALNLEALETLVRFAGMAVELLSVSHVAAVKPRAEAAPPATTGYSPTREYAEPAPVEAHEVKPERVTDHEPPPIAAEPAAGESEARRFGSEPIPYAPVVAQPTNVESLAELAVEEPHSDFGAPESVAAPFATPAVAESATTPVSGRRRYGSYDEDLPIAVVDEEERRAHNDARRFARLLVSEIKLYNEDKVVEGRSHSDLYTRLREYIDRSRDMYDKRVKPVVSGKYDYFHHELVNTLAEGDAAKLGEAYPGTTVTA